MKKCFQALLCLLPLVSACQSVANENAMDNTIKEQSFPSSIDTLIKGIMQDHEIPGLSLAVVNRDSILITKGYGYTSSNGEQPVDQNTIFGLQSVSKTFVALSCLKAHESGLIHLDTPVVHYMPDFYINSSYEADAHKKITLRHLLSHTSGLPADAPRGNTLTASFGDNQVVSLKDRVESLDESWMHAQVGDRYAYSNVGFDLAAHLLEVVTANSLNSYIRANLFLPLNMQSSQFDFDLTEKVSNRALGHCYGYDGKVPLRFSAMGAGGMYSNAVDMAEFLRIQLNPQSSDVLKANLLRGFTTIPFSSNANGYALGITVDKLSRCTAQYGHTGNGYGFTATMIWLPQKNIGIAIMANRESSYNGLIQIQNQILDHYTTEQNCHPTRGLVSEIKEDDTEFFQRVAQTYSDGNTRLSFALRGKQFGIIAPNDGRFIPIRFMSRYHWVFEDNDTYHFQLTVDSKDQPRYVTNLNNGLVLLAEPEYSTTGPNKTNWQDYEGSYRSYAYGILPSVETIDIQNGYLRLNGNPLKEHKTGIFIDHYGQVVNFTKEPVLIDNAPHIRLD